MKYINVDLLRAVIKEHTLFYAGQANLLDGTNALDGYDEVLAIIDSLQQEQSEDIVVIAKTFLDALSKTPYNNKPITDAQTIVKQLLLFFDNPKEYNPDAILEQSEIFDTVAFQKGVAEGRRLEREEMPKWRNYGPNIIKDPFVTDLGSLVVGEKCIRIYELYNLPGFKND